MKGSQCPDHLTRPEVHPEASGVSYTGEGGDTTEDFVFTSLALFSPGLSVHLKNRTRGHIPISDSLLFVERPTSVLTPSPVPSTPSLVSEGPTRNRVHVGRGTEGLRSGDPRDGLERARTLDSNAESVKGVGGNGTYLVDLLHLLHGSEFGDSTT